MPEGGKSLPANEGDWLAVKIIRESGGIYFASRWRLLSRCRRPPLSDMRRYETAARDWPFFLDCVKKFFQQRGLEPIETPSLVRCPGTEPHLLPFQTEWSFGAEKRAVFLPTSPEMSLKKLLCQNGTDVFEIKKCFRNGERGALHEPEFYMAEWYRAFWPLDSLMDEAFALLKSLIREKPFKIKLGPLKVFSLQELFQSLLRFPLRPETKKEELADLAKKRGAVFSAGPDYPSDYSLSDYSWEDLFHLLFLRCIEPKLPRDRPVIVKDYPPRLRAFAKINPRGWADRFELYWQGFELANAFYEVTDRAEQESLFQEHLAARGDSVPADRELLRLMDEHGMPPCSGIALGAGPPVFDPFRQKPDFGGADVSLPLHSRP